MSKLAVTVEGHTFDVALEWTPQSEDTITVSLNGQPVTVTIPNAHAPWEETEWLIIDGRPLELVFDPDLQWIRAYSGIHRVEIRDLEAVVARPRSGDGRVKAPIPGLITRTLVAPGDPVEAGQPLLVLEAMKMENEIRAPRAGLVQALLVTSGQGVLKGELLAEIG